MSNTRSIWAVGLWIVLSAGCSADTAVDRPTSGVKPVASTEDPGTYAADSGTQSADPVDALVENPNQLPVDVADAGEPDAMSMDAGDDCEAGTFCQPTVPDPTDCGKLELKTNVKMVEKPGNVLVVFDRSRSMEADWGGSPKYEAAGNALLSAITPLKDLLTVGGIFFPSGSDYAVNCPSGCDVLNPAHFEPGPGGCCLNTARQACSVHAIDQSDELPFGPADAFIAGLPMQWHIPDADGTPLEAGIAQAAAAIDAQMFTDPLIVIVMTDGEPNCNTNTSNVLDQIAAWKAAGIQTHVIGLPGAQNAADLLNTMAEQGGTGTYLDPKDPAELEARLRTVVSSTVVKGFESCTFELDPKAEVPDKLHVIVTQDGTEKDVPRDLSKDAYWTINADGDQVDLDGQLCDMAKDGTFEAIRFVFGCKDVPPPIDPPPPPPLN